MANYTKAIDLAPKTAVHTYLARGRLWQNHGKREEAIADFQKVLEIINDPKARAEAEAGLKALDGK
ncbi:MAG: hypothetical protein ACJ78Q_18565 [Chloroflexia bacterium]